VKIGDVIQDSCFPEDTGIIVSVKGDKFLVVELTTGKADWYHRKYVKTCRVISCE
jgi:ribosomal protein S17